MEDLQLQTRDGKVSDARGTVKRYSTAARALRGLGVVVVGVLLGGVSVLIPVVHLISTWLLPLTSLIVGGYLSTIRVVIGVVEGPCPACGEAQQLKGGPQASDLWVRCSACATPMRFKLADE